MAERRTAGFLEMIEELEARYLVGVAGVCELWLIRHADAYHGLETLPDGRIDPPLSERGRGQAERLAARLAAVPLQAIWSSDLRRARETAEAVAGGRALGVRTDPRLGEVRTYWDESRELPELPERPAPGTYPFPEPEAEVAERMRSVVADIVADLAGAGATGPRAAVVTHNATIAIYLGSLLGLPWGQLRVMPLYTSVSVVAIKGEQAVVRSIADVTHLA